MPCSHTTTVKWLTVVEPIERVFDDCPPGAERSPACDPFDRRQRRVHDHAHDHGPMGVASLQADTCPREPRTFGRVLGRLERGGFLEVRGGRVEPAVHREGLADPRKFDPPALDRPMTVRPAHGEDLPALLELVGRVAREREQPDTETLAERLTSEARIHRRDADRWRTVYVADVDGDVCGWAHLRTPGPDRAQAVELGGGVARPVRRKGVGSRVLRYVTDRAGTWGVRRIRQHIRADDHDAFQFLRTRGWCVETDAGAGDGGTDRLQLVTELDGP